MVIVSPLHTIIHMSIAQRADTVRNSMLLVLGFCLGSVSDLPACTVFSDASDGTALAGRNWDMTEDGTLPVMWFVPASKGAHGRVCFGRHNDCEDGMNDQGLFVAVAAAPPSGRFRSKHMSISSPMALDGLLANCANVEEATAWLEKKNVLINGSWTTYKYLGLFGKTYGNSGVGGHFLVADRSGNSVVFEWEKGKLNAIRKTGRHQLITNFLLAKPDLGGSPCPRFAAATRILDEASQPSVATCAAALKATSRELTRYSVVYDLARGDAQVYCRGRFATPRTIHLGEELKKGAHEVNLYAWFDLNAVESDAGASASMTEGSRK
jgi:hypothetical protein